MIFSPHQSNNILFTTKSTCEKIDETNVFHISLIWSKNTQERKGDTQYSRDHMVERIKRKAGSCEIENLNQNKERHDTNSPCALFSYGKTDR
jgi:hypothetical protein